MPPHERARDRLREELDLLHQPEPYCMAISGALRSYLGERFHWHAVERTTHEFIQEIRGDPALSDALKTDLQGILTTCDLVKFARDEPSITDLRGLYDSAWHLVLQTTLEETPSILIPSGRYSLLAFLRSKRTARPTARLASCRNTGIPRLRAAKTGPTEVNPPKPNKASAPMLR